MTIPRFRPHPITVMLWALVAVCCIIACTGCTTIDSPVIGKYRNGLFNKQFSELTVQQTITATGTNTIVILKGWKSDGAAIAEAAAHGAVTALKGVNGVPPIATSPAPADTSAAITLRP